MSTAPKAAHGEQLIQSALLLNTYKEALVLQRASLYSSSCYNVSFSQDKTFNSWLRAHMQRVCPSHSFMYILCVACLLPDSLSDGSVGQLLLLAHHRGSGGRSEASELGIEGDRRRVRRAGRRAFRGSRGDGCRDGAIFQPACAAAVRTGAADDL